MKYSSEVLALMPAFPGRKFKIEQLVRYATRGAPLSKRQRHAARICMKRLMDRLEAQGMVKVEAAQSRGASAFYSWCGFAQSDTSAQAEPCRA